MTDPLRTLELLIVLVILMANGPVSKEFVAQSLGVSRFALNRSLRKLDDFVEVVRFGMNAYLVFRIHAYAELERLYEEIDAALNAS